MKQELLRKLNLSVANAIFNIAFVVWTVVYGIAALPLILFLPPQKLIEVRKIWCKVILFLLRVLIGVSFEIRGLENFTSSGNFIVASKHHSPLDVFLLSDIVKKPAFIIKKDLLRIPIFGWYMIATKMIAIDYSKQSSGLVRLRNMIKQARVLSKNRTIVIYPEGTRTKVGEKVEYQKGVFALYKDLNLPVVPIALNAGKVWPIGYFDAKKPGKVVVEILKPIPIGISRNEFLERLESMIEIHTTKMLETADAS